MSVPNYRLRTAGRIAPALLAFLGTVMVAGFLTLFLVMDARRGRDAHTGTPLVLHCAAGVKLPVEEIASRYQQEYGVPVQLQFGGSHTLLANIAVTKVGDLYLPADDSYVTLARNRDLVAESIPVAQMTAILAVRKGNPKKVQRLADLLRADIVLAQANPDAAAIGKTVRLALQKSGHWTAVEKKTHVFKPTVNDIANDLKLGTADAGFIWDGLLKQYPELEAVPCPELAGASGRITVGILKGSAQPTAALRFARYLAAIDRGQSVFDQHGFKPAGGDAWEAHPELRLMSGAMLRPALEETIKQFEQREGVTVTRVYNGCGILVAQMRAGERPDAYFSCDQSFMTQVSDLFVPSEDISQNPMVILVQKGNPKQIKGISDLGRTGLKLGLAHEQKSALGALTKRMLEASGLYESLRKNLAVESATGDFLVNQLRAGALDAVIVYTSNGALVRNEVETIPIHRPGAFAIQPYAVGKQTRYPQLAARLQTAIKTASSKERFEALGFSWQAKTSKAPE